MDTAIPGLDYSKCSICNQWIIHPSELVRIESERDKAKKGKPLRIFWEGLIEEKLAIKEAHEKKCLV